MATVSEMKATLRAAGTKGAVRAERRAGRVPAVIYGDNKPPLAISLDFDRVKQRMNQGRFLTTVCEIDIDGTKHRVIPRDLQLDPLKNLPVHVDFLRLGEGAKVRVRIPIHVRNADQSPGIKRGGTVNMVTHAVELLCPVDAIPDAIEVDIAGVEIGHSKHLSDVTLPSDVEAVVKTDPTLITIVPPSGYAEEMKAAAEAAAAAAEAAAAAPAEGAAPGAAAPAPEAEGEGGAPAGGEKK